jgi:hypothetical protein
MIDTNTKFKLNYSNEQVRTLHSACRTSIQKKTQEKFFHAVACIYISYCTWCFKNSEGFIMLIGHSFHLNLAMSSWIHYQFNCWCSVYSNNIYIFGNNSLLLNNPPMKGMIAKFRWIQWSPMILQLCINQQNIVRLQVLRTLDMQVLVETSVQAQVHIISLVICHTVNPHFHGQLKPWKFKERSLVERNSNKWVLALKSYSIAIFDVAALLLHSLTWSGYLLSLVATFDRHEHN